MLSSKFATKRESTNSPIKKRPKEIVSVSSEELNDAILRAVKQALTEQQHHFDKAVQAAIKGAVDNLVIPQLTDLKCQVKQVNESVSGLACDVEELGKSIQKVIPSMPLFELKIKILETMIDRLHHSPQD